MKVWRGDGVALGGPGVTSRAVSAQVPDGISAIIVADQVPTKSVRSVGRPSADRLPTSSRSPQPAKEAIYSPSKGRVKSPNRKQKSTFLSGTIRAFPRL